MRRNAAGDHCHHLQMPLDLSDPARCAPQSSDGHTGAKRDKHQAAEITEAHMQVNTEHNVLLPLEANILFHSMALFLFFLSLFTLSPLSPHTRTHTAVV